MNHYADGVEVPPCSTADLRRVALKIRELFDLQADKAFPVAHFIEYALPLLYPDFVLEVVPISKLGDRRGETLPDTAV